MCVYSMALVDGCVMIPRQTSLLAQEHTYDDGGTWMYGHITPTSSLHTLYMQQPAHTACRTPIFLVVVKVMTRFLCLLFAVRSMCSVYINSSCVCASSIRWLLWQMCKISGEHTQTTVSLLPYLPYLPTIMAAQLLYNSYSKQQ